MTPRRILTLDASTTQACIAIIYDRHVISARTIQAPHGVADALPQLLQACLIEAAARPGELDAIAVTIGPGSFTGLRASIALARGLGLAVGVPVYGVTLTEAFAKSAALGRPLWIAVTARRGRVFLERNGVAASYADDALPLPGGPVAIAGDQAAAVAGRLAAAGHDVLLTSACYPQPIAMADAVRDRHAAGLPPRLAVPAYVDPPEAKLPAPRLTSFR